MAVTSLSLEALVFTGLWDAFGFLCVSKSLSGFLPFVFVEDSGSAEAEEGSFFGLTRGFGLVRLCRPVEEVALPGDSGSPTILCLGGEIELDLTRSGPVLWADFVVVDAGAEGRREEAGDSLGLRESFCPPPPELFGDRG